MIGDRLLTDVVFGNLNGMFTILTDAFTENNDNWTSVLFRRIERRMLTAFKSLKRTENE